MSNINQFMSGGGFLIGDATYFPDSGTTINRADGSVFLRSGVVALTSTYPLTAGVETIMVHGAGTVTLPVSFAKITGCANNGSGTIVLCYNDSVNVLVSTNSGASWSTVAHNLSGLNGYSVIWNGSRFILAAGSGSTTIRCSYSTTGTSFTAGGTVTLAENTANLARIAWDGTTAVIVSGYNSGFTQIATTSDGVTLTAQTVPLTTLTGLPIILNLPSLGASRWLITCTGSTVALQSTNAVGTAWTSVTMPAICTSFSVGLGMFVATTTSQIYTSTTGATGSWTNITPSGLYASSSTSTASFAFLNEVSIHFDGTRFIIGTGTGQATTGSAFQFAYTTDFQKFTTRQIIPNTIPNTNVGLACIPAGTGMIFVQNGTGTAGNRMIYANNWFTSSEYTGSSAPFVQPLAALSNVPSRPNFGYVRVK